jgi:hypothetical protein
MVNKCVSDIRWFNDLRWYSYEIYLTKAYKITGLASWRITKVMQVCIVVKNHNRIWNLLFYFAPWTEMSKQEVHPHIIRTTLICCGLSTQPTKKMFQELYISILDILLILQPNTRHLKVKNWNADKLSLRRNTHTCVTRILMCVSFTWLFGVRVFTK